MATQQIEINIPIFERNLKLFNKKGLRRAYTSVYNHASEYLVVPPLCTFNVPREKIGDEIGRYVVGIITDDRPQYSVFVVRCEYIERQSVRKIK